ncbi:hypothetical protein ASG62_05910 [Aureimonas sp. Leaf427]|nr:hypothetical protein ASG62_05910 [Aureimonas sp. Leaf427]
MNETWSPPPSDLWDAAMAVVRPTLVLGDHHFIDRLRKDFAGRRVTRAVTQHDTSGTLVHNFLHRSGILRR